MLLKVYLILRFVPVAAAVFEDCLLHGFRSEHNSWKYWIHCYNEHSKVLKLLFSDCQTSNTTTVYVLVTASRFFNPRAV